jgi:TAG lipase/lysophosphatidylethanolamine acyltransferase
VNHFIVSQARPYLVPFLRSDLHGPNPRTNGRFSLSSPLLRLGALEIRHRLNQIDSLGFLPTSIRRFLIDESIPGASLLLVPEVGASDFVRLLENPTRESVDYWILRGEKSVWPAIGALKVRCAIEVELDRGYQIVRRRKPRGMEKRSGSQQESPTGPTRDTMSSGRERALSTGGEHFRLTKMN